MLSEQKLLPAAHYVPSLSREEAFSILDHARKAAENGFQRTNHLIEELFLRDEL